MNLVAPSNCYLGYGHVGWNILYNLYKAIDVTFFPIGNLYVSTNVDVNKVMESTHHLYKDKYDKNDSTLVIWHEFGLFEKALGSGKKLGLSFFECNKLDRVRTTNLSSMDVNIQSSEWGVQVLADHGIYSVKIPCGYDPTIFCPKEVKRKDDDYHFFNIGKMEYRKGHDVIIEAFCKAFDKTDNVKLHMLWDNPFLNEQEKGRWCGQYKNSKLGDKVVFHNLFKTDEELADFIRSMDFGLFPTRAEGFGLPILQSLACGKPLITTDYSAQTEFARPHNSFLLQISEYEPMYDGKFFTSHVPPGATWAKITDKNIDQLVDIMRFAYEDRFTGENINLVPDYTWENTICKLLPIL